MEALKKLYSNNCIPIINLTNRLREVAGQLVLKNEYVFWRDDTHYNNIGINILSLTDKIDHLTGFFSINKQPSGSKDPFALRRSALGIVRIIVEGKISINIDKLIKFTVNLFRNNDLNLEKSPIDQLQAIDEKASESEIRSFLGGFNFRGDKAKSSIEHFSGGEKARLALSIIAFQKPNLLLMDEPTNHLDMDMRQALTVALQDFGGAILLISHDRHLLANTVDEFLIINEGNLSSFKGDLEDYRKTVLKGSSSKETAKKEKSEHLPKLSKQEIKEIKNRIIIHEKTLKRLQRKLSETEDILNSPESYESDDGPDLHSLLRDQANLTSEIELTEQEWLELNEKLEGRNL